MTPKKIFGTDGLKGRANYFPMTVEVALALGRAAGKIFCMQAGKHRVVIGKDTRLSCYMFENALIAGLCSMGVDTLMVGPLPTPGIAFITRAYRADAGIVVSASQNDFYDNGINFFSSDGLKFPDEWELKIEELIAAEIFEDCLPSDISIGKNYKIDDASGRYIEFVKNTFPRSLSLSGIKISLDCANGAGYRVAPMIFRELDAEVVVHGDCPNGLNINKECGSLHPPVIQKSVIDHKSHVGIALDGDGDRVIMVDENAQIIDGESILAICAKDLQEKGLLRHNKVVSTVMCNLSFIKAMQSQGIETIQTKVGDRYVSQGMLEHDANLGGEKNGHVIFSNFSTTGDGLVTALQVLSIMVEKRTSLSKLNAAIKKYPQAIVNVRVSSKPPLENLKQVQKSIVEAEKCLADQGRVLVRYSETEQICRVLVEGPELHEVYRLLHIIAAAIEKEIG